MLQEIFDLVRNSAEPHINQQNREAYFQPNEVVAEATNTVASGLRNIVAGGGANGLLELFGTRDKSHLLQNSVVSMMIGHLTGKLINKHQLNHQQASGLAGSLIPDVLSSLVQKVHDPNERGFSLDNLLSSITGGASKEVVQSQSGGSISDILARISGNSQPVNHGGSGGGLMDILGKLAEGAQFQQQRNGGGGLMDLIRGFIK
ncbi:MAG: hypothetical protein KF880_10055 [Ferruginibacter sp.]|nr:hypothetical protein [Ferruginibacter sp.]